MKRILVAPEKLRSGGAASDNLENALDHTDATRVGVLETAFIVIAECDQTRNEHVAQELRRSGRAQVHDQVQQTTRHTHQIFIEHKL